MVMGSSVRHAVYTIFAFATPFLKSGHNQIGKEAPRNLSQRQ